MTNLVCWHRFREEAVISIRYGICKHYQYKWRRRVWRRDLELRGMTRMGYL